MKTPVDYLMRNEYAATALKKVAVIVFGFASSVLVVRYLGPELRGDYAVLVNWASILTVVINLGVNSYYQQARLIGGKCVIPKHAAYTLLMTVLTLMLALLAGAASESAMLIGMLTCVMALRLQIQTYHMIESLSGDAKAVITSHVSYLFLLGLMYLFLPRMLLFALIALLAKEFVLATASFLGLAKAYSVSIDQTGNLRIFLSDTLSSLRKFRSIKLTGTTHFFFLSVFIVMLYKIDVILLSFLGVTGSRVGIYSVGVVIAEYLWILSDIFKDVQISRTARGSSPAAVAIAVRRAIFLTGLIYGLFLLIGRPFVEIVFGGGFTESFGIARLMLLANIFMVPCKILGAYLVSTGKVEEYMKAMILAVLTNIALNIALVPVVGIYGAIIANIVSYAIPAIVVTSVFVRSTNVSLATLLLVGKDDFRSIFSRLASRR